MKNEAANKKKSKKSILIAGIVLVIISTFVLFSNYGLVNRLRLEQRKAELNEEITLRKKSQDSLQKAIERLENDSLEIERLAREKYGMKKPGEKVFIIKEK